MCHIITATYILRIGCKIRVFFDKYKQKIDLFEPEVFFFFRKIPRDKLDMTIYSIYTQQKLFMHEFFIQIGTDYVLFSFNPLWKPHHPTNIVMVIGNLCHSCSFQINLYHSLLLYSSINCYLIEFKTFVDIE